MNGLVENPNKRLIIPSLVGVCSTHTPNTWGFFTIMEILKTCKECGETKPLSMFYKHPRMLDGHLNICIDCKKRHARDRYKIMSKSESWMESERVRHRDKYKRLGYVVNDFKSMSEINKIECNTSRDLRALGIDTNGKEAHHWNYNKPKSVFLLSRKAHHRIHRYMSVNRDNKFCYTHDGIKLETEEQAKEYFEKILSQYDDIKESLNIINY